MVDSQNKVTKCCNGQDKRMHVKQHHRNELEGRSKDFVQKRIVECACIRVCESLDSEPWPKAAQSTAHPLKALNAQRWARWRSWSRAS